MERWDVVGVIAVLVALFAAIITPMIKLNTTITKLNGSIDALGEKVTDINCENKKQHDDLFGTMRRQGESIADHETRIKVIESFPVRTSRAQKERG